MLALTRALGPYAVFARPQLPQVTSPPIRYACSELCSIVSVGVHVHVCVYARHRRPQAYKFP